MPQLALNPRRIAWSVPNYDLAATLSSGQAFRWDLRADSWEGVIGRRWVRLSQHEELLEAEVWSAVRSWSWLERYLQLEIDLDEITATFPEDEALRRSVEVCWGLRLLRQEPWECLASFILSSSKQILQIQQIISSLCRRWGAPLAVPRNAPPAWSFPTAETIAQADELELRACKMGFRAPNLLSTARKVADRKVDLTGLHHMELPKAREVLMELPGVGRKIADCVLLFAYGFQEAFPVDVWVMKAMRQLYFTRCKPSPARVHRFVESHFGPHAGYAQQYLFHYMRHHQPFLRSNQPPGAS